MLFFFVFFFHLFFQGWDFQILRDSYVGKVGGFTSCFSHSEIMACALVGVEGHVLGLGWPRYWTRGMCLVCVFFFFIFRLFFCFCFAFPFMLAFVVSVSLCLFSFFCSFTVFLSLLSVSLSHYEIREKIGENAYRLRLPPNMKAHDIVNVSKLKLYV